MSIVLSKLANYFFKLFSLSLYDIFPAVLFEGLLRASRIYALTSTTERNIVVKALFERKYDKF